MGRSKSTLTFEICSTSFERRSSIFTLPKWNHPCNPVLQRLIRLHSRLSFYSVPCRLRIGKSGIKWAGMANVARKGSCIKRR